MTPGARASTPDAPDPGASTPDVLTPDSSGPDLFRVPGRAELAGRALAVAPTLLGAHLVTGAGEDRVVVRVTEVEAYQGAEDPGSHAFRGLTRRNATMFGPAGHLYAYRHLGLHTCVNVVCGPPGEAAAVLVRAGEVAEGAALARRRRAERGVVRRDVDLARGPARLTVALGLGPDVDGVDLLDVGSGVRLLLPARPVPAGAARWGPRVGVSGAGGDGVAFPWRAWLAGEPTVSVYRPAAPRRRRGAAQSSGAPTGARDPREQK